MTDYSFKHGYDADPNPEDQITLTSAAGRFYFPKSTIMSHAKLIRDTVTASFRGTLGPHIPRVDARQAHLVTRWVANHMGGPIASANYAFEWDPTGCWSN